MMRVLEGVNAGTDMAEDIDQVVGIGQGNLNYSMLCLGIKLRKDELVRLTEGKSKL